MSNSKQTSGKRGTAARLRGVPLATFQVSPAMAAQWVKGKRAARRRLAELYSESDYPQTPETRQRPRQRQPKGVQR